MGDPAHYEAIESASIDELRGVAQECVETKDGLTPHFQIEVDRSANLAHAVRQHCSEPDISARSVLVTVLGDSVLPVTKTLWLSSLFELAEPFGFSERLVRTSMFRLVAEGWMSNERIGRRSRYSMTLLAVRESEDADRRIYSRESGNWDGSWTFAVLDTPRMPAPERDRIARHLRWHGFVALGRGLMASPSAGVSSLRELLHLVQPAAAVPIGTSEFDELDGLVEEGYFADVFRTADTETAYGRFLSRYQPWSNRDIEAAAPLEAYALRTMLVHELRRIRLRTPDIPAELLPPEWIGDLAYDLAADLYARLSRSAARALSEILEVDYPEVMPQRFES